MDNSRRLLLSLLFLLVNACTRQAHSAPYINFSNIESNTNLEETADPLTPPTRVPDQPIYTPTPNVPKPLPTLRTEDIYYAVQWGDTLKSIAFQYNLLPEQIIDANQITNPSLIYTGQELLLPAPKIGDPGPDFKIIPDSELVNSPYTVRFQIESFINNKPGYLKDYEEEVDGELLTGPEIVRRISADYSVNPRLLIAIIEHQSNWITERRGKNNPYPLKHEEPGDEGLYHQLAWVADELNRGYYLWRVKGIGSWTMKDGINIPIDETINAGTAGVQHLFSQLLPYRKWLPAVSEDGFVVTYTDLFGYPFDYTLSPLIPDGLIQPELQLPFEPGISWLFTGGPHGGWDTGSAWAALDFAPPPGDVGCSRSKEWVVASADGTIVRSDHGAVVQSIDGDSYGQTGWAILYMHIESKDRVKAGTYLRSGDRIGHPSCEGGISTGTHLHIARLYNGEWIPADQNIPFNMDGWISQGSGWSYEGVLVRGDQVVQAEDTNTETNHIQR